MNNYFDHKSVKDLAIKGLVKRNLIFVIIKTIEKILFCPQNRQNDLNNDEENISFLLLLRWLLRKH